ncbi:MAG: hypothetical protein KAT65_27110 [Methanophagales archaeon]|nr:hypothetical protein [Methanophagales archaeon]
MRSENIFRIYIAVVNHAHLKKLSQLLENMTLKVRAEVETFVAFMITRRKLQHLSVLTDDIPSQELMQIVMESGSFNWAG